MKKLWEITKKCSSWAWKAIAAFGVILGILGVYHQIFNPPNIFAQITSEINVLDVHEPLRDLQILFQGDNIQEKKLNLRIYRVKIENNGGTNITQNDFDQSDNWGIRIEKGRIIEVRLVDSNSKYIDKGLFPQIQDNNIVKFNKIIFDKGSSFIVELLVLHDKDIPPVLYRTGKIAGVQESESKILALEHSEPFLTVFFYGTLVVNIARFVLYALTALGILIAVLSWIIKLQEKRMKMAQNPQPPQQPN